MMSLYREENTDKKFFDHLDNLFFNIPSGNPRPEIIDFIKKYTSLIPPKSTLNTTVGGWTAYPVTWDGTKMMMVYHSFSFRNHPYFSKDYLHGRLEVENLEVPDGIHTQSMNLIFEIEWKREAYQLFKSICHLFEPLSTRKKITTIKTKTIAEYNNDKDSVYNSLSISIDINSFLNYQYLIRIIQDNNLPPLV